MFGYIYYRSYCFFEKNRLAFDPHNFAVNIPMFIQIFVFNLTYFCLVKAGKLQLIKDEYLLIYPILLLGLYEFNHWIFKGKIAKYKARWKNEANEGRIVRGVILSLFALFCFASIAFFANELHKLRHQKNSTASLISTQFQNTLTINDMTYQRETSTAANKRFGIMAA